MPAADINFVAPERFENGKWCKSAQRQLGEGDIAASYSADRIAMGEPIRRPFRWKSALWVNVGSSGARQALRVQAYRLVPVSLFGESSRSYAATVANGEEARHSPKGFYHGMEVSHRGQDYALCGAPEVFSPAHTEQLALF